MKIVLYDNFWYVFRNIYGNKLIKPEYECLGRFDYNEFNMLKTTFPNVSIIKNTKLIPKEILTLINI